MHNAYLYFDHFTMHVFRKDLKSDDNTKMSPRNRTYFVWVIFRNIFGRKQSLCGLTSMQLAPIDGSIGILLFNWK